VDRQNRSTGETCARDYESKKERKKEEGAKFGSLIEGALMYITTQTGELWPRGILWPQKVKGIKM